MRIGILAIAAILGLTLANNLPAQTPADKRPHDGHAAVRALIGNTLVYSRPDQADEEIGVFLDLDGTGLGAVRDAEGQSVPQLIRWAMLSDGKFCVFKPGRKAWDGDCGVLSIAGSEAALAQEGGPVWSGRVMEGDAWTLEPLPPGQERLTGKAAIQALAGNTLVFISYGGDREYRAQFFMPNGKVRPALNDQSDFDHWVLQPDERWSIREKTGQLCLSGGTWKKEFCARVTMAGDLVTLEEGMAGEEEKAGPLHARLLTGDARYLSPDAVAASRKIAARLTGNSLLVKAADRKSETDSIIYFRRGGAGRGKWGSAASKPIKWMVQSNGRLCIAEEKLAFQNAECAALSIEGNAVTFTAPGRPTIPGQILKGNALKI